jgi:hypothetical protein
MKVPQPEASPKCPRCQSKMELVVTIAPFGVDPGLLAHICPKCGHASSRLSAALPRYLDHSRNSNSSISSSVPNPQFAQGT